MDPTVKINERIDVVTVFRKQGDVSSLCLPHKMRWRDREIIFTELGLRHPTIQGKRMVHVFHMSDGANGYRLEFDAQQLTWSLLAVLPEDS